MWLQFLSQNAHFVVYLFAALVSMGICWLYLDAWSNRRNITELFKWVGFGLLGLSFLAEATVVEQSVLGKSLFGHWAIAISILLRLAAYASIIVGQLIDPLQVLPNNLGIQPDSPDKPQPIYRRVQSIVVYASITARALIPAGALVIAMLYWRRTTKGLERHYKPVAWAFLLFAISDFLGLAALLRSTTNPVLYTWVAAFGWIWWIQLIVLISAVITLGLWTWGYLLERFFSQLFMIMTGMVVVIFTIISVGFTGLLLRNIQSDSLVNLQTAANVLNYALASKKSETASAASQLASRSDVASAVGLQDRTKLRNIMQQYLSDKKLSGILVTNQSGQVVMRGQDTEQWGDSLSNNTLVKRALIGLNQSTMRVIDGVSSPIVQVQSAMVIKDSSGVVIGSVLATIDLNSAFTEGLKQTTGLQSSVYGGNVLAATTLTSNDGKTRPIGVKLSNNKIKDEVLVKGGSSEGTITLQQRQLLTVFAAIKDVDNAPVGMLMVAQPQTTTLKTAGRSVELTFIISTALLILSIYPVVLISRSLVRQVT